MSGRSVIRSLALLLSLVACLAFVPAASAAAPVVESLPNGLKIVVQHLDRAPVVSIQVWVRAGSRLEVGPERGLTHQIEHMIFKGTPLRGLGKVAGEIEAVGGRINAYTSLDHTVYYTDLPAESWRVGLDVLADAIKNSLFDATELEKEKKVVLEEWRMGRDNPDRMLSQALFKEAFSVHPYKNPVIGYENTVKGFNRRMILDYMAKWYTGGRMTVVVVGDIPAAEVMARAKAGFADVKPGLKEFKAPVEPSSPGLRFKAMNGQVKEANLALGFAIPGLHDPSVPALDLLSELLSGGRAALLTAKLWAEKGLVTSVSASDYTPLDAGLFWVSLDCRPDKLNQAVEELWKLLRQSTKVPFSAQELARAKLSFEAGQIRERETMHGQASKLGFYQDLMGSLKAEKTYMAQVAGLSAEQVRLAAAKTFRPDKLAAVLMLPQGRKLPDSDWLRNRLIKVAATDGACSLKGEAPRSGVKRMELPGGTKLLVLEDKSLPLVAVEAVARGGLLEEPADKNGLNQLMASVWTRGVGGLSAAEVDRRVEDMAGSLSAYSGRNSTGLSGNFLSRFIDDGLELFCRALTSPDFPKAEVEKRRADQLSAIARRQERPEAVAFDKFRQAVYQGSPYERNALGTAETVKKLTRRDLVDFHHRLIRSDNLVIAVVGDVNAEKVRKKLAGLLKSLRPGFKSMTKAGLTPLPEGGLDLTDPGPGKAQVHTLFGFRGPGMKAPDSVALDVLAAALSGQSGRLFLDLRDKQSLAYALAAVNRAGVGQGAFAFYVGSAPAKAAKVKTELIKQLAAVRSKALAGEEFTRARASLLADWVLDSQSLSARAQRMALYERLGLGYDYEKHYAESLKALTPEQVLKAAQKWLDPAKAIWVRVGPLK